MNNKQTSQQEEEKAYCVFQILLQVSVEETSKRLVVRDAFVWERAPESLWLLWNFRTPGWKWDEPHTFTLSTRFQVLSGMGPAGFQE